MIKKNKFWKIIVEEMKTKHRLDKLAESVMKKIQELDLNNGTENTNK